MNAIISLSCPRCNMYTFLQRSKICVYCGYRVMKPKDTEEEIARKKAEEQKSKKDEKRKFNQRKRATLRRIHNVAEKSTSEIGKYLKKNKDNSFFNEVTEIRNEFMKLRSIYYKNSGLDDEYFEMLKQFVPQLPFKKKYLKLKYDLGCIYFERGDNESAYNIFREFIDNYQIDYKNGEVKERYQECKPQKDSLSRINTQSLNGAIRIRDDIFKYMDNGDNKKFDQVFNKKTFLQDAILLPHTGNQSADIDQNCPNEISLKGLRKQLVKILSQKRLSKKYSAEIQDFHDPKNNSTTNKVKRLLVIIPKKQSSLMLKTGYICPAVNIENMGNHVSLIYQFHFRPLPQDTLGNWKVRDFNAQLKETVLGLSEVDNNEVMQKNLTVLRKLLEDSVRMEISQTSETIKEFKL